MINVYKFASTQFNLPVIAAHNAILAGLRVIPNGVLKKSEGKTGREDHPHVTVMYGLSKLVIVDQVREALKDMPPFRVRFGRTGAFEGVGGGTADCVWVGLTDSHGAGGLYGLRKRLLPFLDPEMGGSYGLPPVLGAMGAGSRGAKKGLDGVEDHGEGGNDEFRTDGVIEVKKVKKYIPHVTLAYVELGRGREFEGIEAVGLTGKEAQICSVVLSMSDGTQHEIQLMGGGRGKSGPKTLDMVNGYRLWNLRLNEAAGDSNNWRVDDNWKERGLIEERWHEFRKSVYDASLWQNFQLKFPDILNNLPLGDSKGERWIKFDNLLIKKFPEMEEWFKSAKKQNFPKLNDQTAKRFFEERMEKFIDEYHTQRWPVDANGKAGEQNAKRLLNYCGIGESPSTISYAASIIEKVFEKGPSGDEWTRALHELEQETGKPGSPISVITKRVFDNRHGRVKSSGTQSTSRSLSDIAKSTVENKNPVQHTKSWITLEDFDDPKVILRGSGRLIRLENLPVSSFGASGEDRVKDQIAKEGHVMVRGTTVEQRQLYDRLKLVKKAFNDKVASDNHYLGKGYHTASKLDGLPGFREKLEKLGIEHQGNFYHLEGDAYEKKRKEYFINLGKNAHKFPEIWAIRKELDLKAKADDMRRRREEDAKNKLNVNDQLRKVSEDLEKYGLQPKLPGESDRDHVVRLNNIHHTSVVLHDNEILNNTKAVPNQHADNPISRKEWIEKNKETLKQQSERTGVRVKPVNEQAKKALGWKTKRDVEGIRNGKRLWGMVENGNGEKHKNSGDCREYFKKWAAEFKPALKPPDHPEDYLEPGVGIAGFSHNQEAWDNFFLTLHKTPNAEKVVKNVIDLKYGLTQLPGDRKARYEQTQQRKARTAQGITALGKFAGEETNKRLNQKQPQTEKPIKDVENTGSSGGLASLGSGNSDHNGANKPIQDHSGTLHVARPGEKLTKQQIEENFEILKRRANSNAIHTYFNKKKDGEDEPKIGKVTKSLTQIKKSGKLDKIVGKIDIPEINSKTPLVHEKTGAIDISRAVMNYGARSIPGMYSRYFKNSINDIKNNMSGGGKGEYTERGVSGVGGSIGFTAIPTPPPHQNKSLPPPPHTPPTPPPHNTPPPPPPHQSAPPNQHHGFQNGFRSQNTIAQSSASQHQDNIFKAVVLAIGLSATAMFLLNKWYRSKIERAEKVTKEEIEEKAIKLKKADEGPLPMSKIKRPIRKNEGVLRIFV